MRTVLRNSVTHLTLAGALLAPGLAHAICWNPFGCAPKNYQECIAGAASITTDSAAQAHIAECGRFPRMTEADCQRSESAWASYLRATGGVEWNWSRLTEKAQCRTHYPRTFEPAAWVDLPYCAKHAERLAQVPNEIDPASGRSKVVQRARQKVPKLLDGLDDRAAIELLHQTYYQDMRIEDVAARAFVDAPPDALGVARRCRELAGLTHSN